VIKWHTSDVKLNQAKTAFGFAGFDELLHVGSICPRFWISSSQEANFKPREMALWWKESLVSHLLAALLVFWLSL